MGSRKALRPPPPRASAPSSASAAPPAPLVPRSSTSLATQAPSVRYRFVVPQYVTSYGQSLRVVGSPAELGGWEPNAAPAMTWGEGHCWTLEAALPARSFEFKIVVFEGHGMRWEGGSNRVIAADLGVEGAGAEAAGAEAHGGEEHNVSHDGASSEGLPVEIVVFLTCHFGATHSTPMQLAVPRASVEDAYETGKATLEFLQRRRAKVDQETAQPLSMPERMRRGAELARLAEAVAAQGAGLEALGGMLGVAGPGANGRGHVNGNGAGPSGHGPSAHHGEALTASVRVPVARGGGRGPGAGGEAGEEEWEEVEALLLAIDSVRLPGPLRRISFASGLREWGTASDAAAASTAAATNGDAALDAAAVSAAPAPAGPSPFLRGELDWRAEELMSAAGELLQEMGAAAPSPESLSSLAVLAEEAGRVAGALAGLEGMAAAGGSRHLQHGSREGAGVIGSSDGSGAEWGADAALAAADAAASNSAGAPNASSLAATRLQLEGLASLGGVAAAGGNGNGNGRALEPTVAASAAASTATLAPSPPSTRVGSGVATAAAAAASSGPSSCPSSSSSTSPSPASPMRRLAAGFKDSNAEQAVDWAAATMGSGGATDRYRQPELVPAGGPGYGGPGQEPRQEAEPPAPPRGQAGGRGQRVRAAVAALRRFVDELFL